MINRKSSVLTIVLKNIYQKISIKYPFKSVETDKDEKSDQEDKPPPTASKG